MPYLRLAGFGTPEVIGGSYVTVQTYTVPGAMSELLNLTVAGACDYFAHLLFDGRTGPAAVLLDKGVGSGCAWLFTRILSPLAHSLDDYGFVQDQVRLVVEHKPDIRKAILEMAVVEMTLDRSLSYTYNRFGFSTAEFDLHVRGIIKAGFDLTNNL
jgi:hypothetical protein